MKRAFTLVELLVVVAIMGVLGTASVGGYRQMQRGMEEYGVKSTVKQFINGAYRRAQIDRTPTVIVFWNEMIREEDDYGTKNKIIVGRAAAIRQQGRLTKIKNGLLIDEFADWNLSYPGEQEDNSLEMDAEEDAPNIKLYNLKDPSNPTYSYVLQSVVSDVENIQCVTVDPLQDNLDTLGNQLGGKGRLYLYGFKQKGGGGSWKVGDPYGLEFQTIQLPDNYVFGDSSGSIPTSINSPVKEMSSLTLYFRPNVTPGNTRVTLGALRPDSSGALAVQRIGQTDQLKETD